MKLNALELGSVLALAAVVAYSAGSVGACAGRSAGLAGEWEASFTLDHAYPRAQTVGRTVHGRMRIGAAHPLPTRTAGDGRPAALQGDFRSLGLSSDGMRVSRVRTARGDSVQLVLAGGSGSVVLVGLPRCGRVTGRWRHATRGDAESGRFELRRTPARGE